MIQNLHAIKSIGYDIERALLDGDTRKFATLMQKHWEVKQGRTEGMSNSEIDKACNMGLINGALGSKLVGAGGAGFIMFYADDKLRLRRAMSSLGYEELRFKFDFEGAKTLLT
jgi:D-glycero-alpha-D-manno-heptose-7-phosphate kinase